MRIFFRVAKKMAGVESVKATMKPWRDMGRVIDFTEDMNKSENMEDGEKAESVEGYVGFGLCGDGN